MNYQVWTKEEFADQWTRQECGDLPAAKRFILAAAKEGKETSLTQELPFELQLKIGEPGGETPKPPKQKKEAGTKIEEGAEHEAGPDKPESD